MSVEREDRFQPFFVTCAAGTELALKDELRELRLHKVRADRGGARFEGTIDHAFRACLHSRIGVRVLMPIARFPAPDGEALYAGTRDVEWERWLTPRHTLAVSAISKQSALTHTAFVAQKTKDAIVDRLRDHTGARPNVDREDPDVAIFVHIAKDEASVHLDVSGESLHRRGWRRAIGEAPLKETLAAALLRLSGWDRERPLIDPTCGSGTIPIEADLWARDVAPGIARDRFGVERWASHDARERAAFRTMRDEARANERPSGPEILGLDVDPRTISLAESNAKRAVSRARFRRASLRDLSLAHAPTELVANPPYGVRLDVRAFWDELAAIRPALRGHRLSLLLQAPPPEGLLPEPVASHRLFNGAIECRLLTWEP
ncbi:THUMP domain-containing class I SAM-dependent RNA methyltransferase [Sandaracinus amylolyticus]|uniref:THUMP domain-containing class I SAM-dependent RNA methyltransferase n=1 Tax=Sandaracinus amylolyticus TaxID=927083 RepID=UPI001F17A527|nr:THUMP domain-containing protein [Sandaracinus amylolyticus]UJR79647.1 Ribosomal RNA large subunit methyltransferase K [Sandaracinus amylolyticus]